MAGGTTQPKVTGHQPSSPWKFHLNSPNQSKVNQHFPKHGSTLTTWPRYPEGSLKSKNKNSGLLKSNFKRATFYQKNCQILKYICAPWGPYPENPVIRPWPQNQQSTLPWLFGLKTAFQNGMTQPCSTNDHGPALPRGDCGGVLPTQPSKPWKLHSNPFDCSKLFMISNFMDRWMDGHTNSIQNVSPLYPIWVWA